MPEVNTLRAGVIGQLIKAKMSLKHARVTMQLIELSISAIPATENEGAFVQHAATEENNPRVWTLSSQKTKNLLLLPPS